LRRFPVFTATPPAPESLAVTTATYRSEDANRQQLQRGSLITALLAGH